VLQTAALVLILLRGSIPLWISFDLANTISVCGIILFYLGIEAYSGNKSSLIPNLIVLALFAVVHLVFTFWQPGLTLRHLNISILWLIVFLECTWLILYRVPRSKFRLTMPVSLVCIAFCMICIARIIKFVISGNDYEQPVSSDPFDTAMILVSQLLLILLTYSLEHMFGSQLLLDMKSEEEKFSKAFDTSPYGIIITRLPSGQIIDINKGFLNITGYSREEIFGKTTQEVHFWMNEGERNSILDMLINTGKIDGREIQFRKKTSELITCLVSGEVITINNEQCILMSIDDISERKNYELELIKSKEKAEESDRLKTAFLHNVSHEIRTPLNAIVGFSTLLGDPKLDSEDKKTFIELISWNSDHLLAIVGDILEISNIEAGVLKLNSDEVNLNGLMTEIYKQFNLKAIKKGIDLKFKAEPSDCASRIYADSTKLLQILSNLISNALKFTDSGHIEYGYELKDGYLEFHVTDTGIGIAADKHDKIFDRFYQVDHTDARKYDGTGLGLAITKAYIELSGGKLWLRSEPGKGATFYFTIPFIRVIQNQIIENRINRY
jgi:PAS domain S-box-containing protein